MSNSKPREGWLIDGFLPEGEIGTIFGEPQAGKTALAIDATISCLLGVPCIGKLSARQVDTILFINQDMNEAHWKQRLSSVYEAKVGPGADPSELIAVHHGDVILDQDGSKFESLLDEHEPDLVFLDSLTEVMFEDPAKHAPVKRALGNVKGAMHNHPCTVVFLAHTRKDGEYYGSQHNRAGVDFTWILERNASGVEGVSDRLIMKKDKARGRQPIQGFEFELGESLEGKWIRGRDDSFASQVEEDLISALSFAISKEDEEEDILVAEFVRRSTPELSEYRARKAFDRSVDAGLMDLLRRRGEHGAKRYEVTPRGYDWYNSHVHPQESETETVQVTVDQAASGDIEIPDVGVNPNLVNDPPEPPEDFYERTPEPQDCDGCGLPTYMCICGKDVPGE